MTKPRTATDREVMASTFWTEMDKVDGFFPAIIDSLGSVDGLVNVLPSQKVTFPDEDVPTQVPIINDVVLWQPRIPGVIIRMPIEKLKGAKVGVFIVDHSIDEWREKGGISNFPIDGRRFNKNDAIAVLGLYPETDPWKVSQKANTFEIQVEEGLKISIGDTAQTDQAEIFNLMHNLITNMLAGVNTGTGSFINTTTITKIQTILSKVTNVETIV